MNNRLDYISNFKEGAIEKMTAMREQFINLDNELRALTAANESVDPALPRSIALARTHLEVALQYAIKSLCLKFEDKGVA